MDIEYKGGNCVVITSKKTVIVTDPKLSLVGLKDVSVNDAIELVSELDFAIDNGQRLLFDSPGEYEVGNISIKAIAGKKMIDPDAPAGSTIFTIDNGDTRVVFFGHIDGVLGDEQLESIGVVDVMIVPVGGGGYTLDAVMASSMVRQIEPKIVIPTHFKSADTSYEVPQAELGVFLKELSAAHEQLPKLKIKNGVTRDVLTVVELTR